MPCATLLAKGTVPMPTGASNTGMWLLLGLGALAFIFYGGKK